jgi:tetratricopeptide (TPR) repeat protein
MNHCCSTHRLSRALVAATAVVVAIAVADAARAQSMIDRVHRHGGVDSGQITGITPLNITLTKNGVESTIAAEEIEFVYLAGEPDDLNSARTALLAGRAAEALEVLETLNVGAGDREEVQADVEFYRAMARGQLAIAGQAKLADATAAVRAFLSARRTSFHVPRAIQLLGDLLLAAGDHAGARTEYEKLAKAKSPYFETLSALLVGRAWLAEGKHAEALQQFDKVLASNARGAQVEALKQSATLERAVSEAAGGQGADAAAAIAAVIAKLDADDEKSLGRAYMALGDCYLAAGDKQGALFAYLNVDLLYDDAADAHAKALHELIALWRAAGHDNRAQEAAQELAEKYPNSRWAK